MDRNNRNWFLDVPARYHEKANKLDMIDKMIDKMFGEFISGGLMKTKRFHLPSSIGYMQPIGLLNTEVNGFVRLCTPLITDIKSDKTNRFELSR
ncbi:hypothetical protein RIR_jg32841.t1 [Rhizophagus irregularis DAOM 181602=DAOM 197198]|nr:hypothetical protein RIR_jg32841.t1 [Rhizophagus irregularis DAOM 181602=DAOM 197198]